MKRTVTMFLAAFMAVTSLSYATVTRTKTLGRVGNFLYDDSNIFNWPSTVVGFSNRFLVELGEDPTSGPGTGEYNPAIIGPFFPGGMGGGALFGLNEHHNLGFFVTGNVRSTANGGISDPYFPGFGTDNELRLDEFMTLFYAYGAENLDFGASLNIATSRDEQKAPEADQEKRSIGRYGAQGGITYWMENDNSFDLAVQFDKTAITHEDMVNNAMTTLAEGDGFQDVAVRARLFWNYTDKVQFVPFVQFMQDNHGVIRDTAADADTDLESDKTENTTIDVALGINHFPTDQIQVITVGGVLLSNTDQTIQGESAGESNFRHIPYVKGGIETEIRSWLDMRAGVEKQLVSTESKGAGDNASEVETTRSDFQGYLGAGLHIGDWTVDTQVNPYLFFHGPNFISGVQEPLNYRVSLVRPW